MSIPVVPPSPTPVMISFFNSGGGHNDTSFVTLMCMSLRTDDVERVFVGLVANRMSSLVRALFKYFAYF